jgi:hypothetical protein
MAIMRWLIVGAVMAGCLAGPVCAQGRKAPAGPSAEDLQKKQDAEIIDRQYKSTLERTRSEKAETRANDPWANMRGNDNSKTKR